MAHLITTYSERRVSTLSVAVLLRDAFSRAHELSGEIEVSIPGVRSRPIVKRAPAAYLFTGLDPGNYTIEVRSGSRTPYYLPADIAVAVPMPNPGWPAFPDRTLADPALLLDDAAQPAAFRAQLAQATLAPSTAYPFPAGASLVRGMVTAFGAPLADATVQVIGQPAAYLTGAGGEYVLFLRQLNGLAEMFAVRASQALYPDLDHNIVVVRGATALQNFVMA